MSLCGGVIVDSEWMIYGTADSADLQLLLGSYGPCLRGEPCPADVDQSGEVDFADLLSVLGAWGDACTP